MFSAWWFKVLMTLSLCSCGWWELNSKYWSVCVGTHCTPQWWGFFSVYCTVQEGQTVSSDIVPCEPDVIVHSIYIFCVHSIYMFCEGLHFPCLDFDPGVFHITEPLARSRSCEGNQGFSLNVFHIEVGHYWEHWWAHETAMLLSIRTSTLLKLGGH